MSTLPNIVDDIKQYLYQNVLILRQSRCWGCLGCVVWRIHQSPGRRLVVSAVPFIPSILLTVLSGFCDSRKEGRRRHICMCSGHRRHITVSRSMSGGAMNPGLATHTINSKFADSGCLWRCVPRLVVNPFLFRNISSINNMIFDIYPCTQFYTSKCALASILTYTELWSH